MKSNIKASHLKKCAKYSFDPFKPAEQFKSTNQTLNQNLEYPKQQQIFISQVSSVCRREASFQCQSSDFLPKQTSEEVSSPNFTLNSQVFGHSRSQYQTSQPSSHQLDSQNLRNLNRQYLQEDPSKLCYEYNRKQKQKISQKQLCKQQRQQYHEAKFGALRLKNRLRNLKNWIKQTKDTKNVKYIDFNKAEAFGDLIIIRKKQNHEQKIKKMNEKYIRDNPLSKLSFYKHLLNQEGINFQNAKNMVNSHFPYAQKKQEDQTFHRSVTNQEITNNGSKLITKIRQIDSICHKTGHQYSVTQLQHQSQTKSQKQQSILKNNVSYKSYRSKILSEAKYSGLNAQFNNSLDQAQLNREIYPKRTAKSSIKESNMHEQKRGKSKKIKLTENYYVGSGIDSESDTKTTRLSRIDYKPVCKLNSQGSLQQISEADQSVQDSVKQ